MLRQPLGVAHQVFDARSLPLLRTIDYEAPGATRVEAGRCASWPRAWDRSASASTRTVREFNAAIEPRRVRPRGQGRAAHATAWRSTKSNWALAIDTPPYVAFPVTCGITFTFGGLRVDEDARVLDLAGRPIAGLFAAGELVGGLFFHNYPGGSGLTAGAVYGRRAGYAAAATSG